MATLMQQMMQPPQHRGTPAITLLSPPRSRAALADASGEGSFETADVDADDAGTVPIDDNPITGAKIVEPRVLRTGAISNITFTDQAAAVRSDLKRTFADPGDIMQPARRRCATGAPATAPAAGIKARPATASPKVAPKAKAKATPKSTPTAAPKAAPKAASAKAAPKAKAKAKAKVRAAPSEAIRHEMRTGSLARRRALYQQYGCTKCRWQTCTPSCWASRGTWPY